METKKIEKNEQNVGKGFDNRFHSWKSKVVKKKTN